MVTMKCRGCKRLLPYEDFPVRKDRASVRPYCKDCVKDIQRARYKAHKEINPFLHKCTRAKSRAAGLKVPFDLTPEYLESIWTGKCAAFGVPINLNTDRSDEYAAELDRFVPALGYVKGNVHFLSRKANRIKNNVTSKELRLLTEWMEGVENRG